MESTAPTPASLMISGAISRLEPQPKFRSATMKSSSFTSRANSGLASSSTCLAYSFGLARREINRPGAMESVLTLLPNFQAFPFISSLIIIVFSSSAYMTSLGSVIKPRSAVAAAVAGLDR